MSKLSLQRLSAVAVATGLLLPSLSPVFAFTDVNSSTEYRTAIEAMQEKGVIEGYADGTFKGKNRINRAEFLKIVLEARGGVETSNADCFPDVSDEWFAKYVCSAKDEEIVGGYPDGYFRPERDINFVEAAKILSLAYGQNIEMYSPDWYEPYARALESSGAIPPSVAKLDEAITRDEMVEIMWRLDEGREDQPAKGYINVKYPSVKVNMAASTPQIATSCVDLQAFVEEASRQGGTPMMNRLMEGDAVAAPANGASKSMDESESAGGDYSQTNVQVQGVDEGDIVKTDGTYLYVVSGQFVRIVRATGDLQVMSTIDLEEVGFSPTDLYIDGNRVVVMGSRWSQSRPGIMEKRMATDMMIWPGYSQQKSEVRIYDVTDKSKPTLERKVAFDGWTVSSRKIEDKLYLVVNQPVYWGGPIPLNVKEADVVPSFEDSKSGDVEKPVANCDDVMILPRVPSPQYMTVGVIPLRNPSAEVKREVVLGAAGNIYASLDNLFVANTEYNYIWDTRADLGAEPNLKTNIYRFEFTDNGIALEAQGSVPGSVLNQFSMDEHKGNFRIATTVDQIWRSENDIKPSTNNLFVLNGELQVVGRLEDMAPGERIYSARFMGDRAYMVTFKQVDPLFVIDTSDPRNPKILGKLKIPGVSDYLHPYDENHIIGFGREAVEAKEGDFAWFQGMKIAMFDVTDVENPKELHKEIIGDRGTYSALLTNHKALLFDKERGLMSFPVNVYDIPDSQQKPGNESAYGTQVFQGAYVYDISLKDGFELRGKVTHYTDEQLEKMGDTWYGQDIERVVRIGEKLLSIAQGSIQRYDLADLDRDGRLDFKTE